MKGYEFFCCTIFYNLSLENRIEDLKIIAKKSIQGFGWTLDQYYDTDYYELMKILNAKEEEDRMVDPTSLL